LRIFVKVPPARRPDCPPRRTDVEGGRALGFYGFMTPIEKKGARFGLALLGAAALFVPGAAAAVQPAYGFATETPGDALSRNLKLIADSPHNVGALVGAGKAALDLGDAQAALTFFARAEQDAPRDGWVKKWMGSALVQLEQPAAALKFFRDAVSFGLPDASVAGDRGLAWDISGDPRRAQRDYRLALSRGGDAEITRRLALSLAISGEREPALQLIQDQVMQRDRAALRTRALVLALTGDRQGADRAVEMAMPGAQAAALEPFLARLPTLSLADRALAVHLGHFPGTGRPASPSQTYAQNAYGGGLPAGYTQTPSYPGPASAAPRQNGNSLLDAGRPDESRPGFGRPVAMTEPAAARRIPGAQSEAPRPAPARNQIHSPPPTAQWSWSRGELSSRRPTQTASATPAPAARRPEPAPPRAAVQEPDEDEAQPGEADATQQPESRPVEIADAAPPVPRHEAAVQRRDAAAAVPPPAAPGSHSRLAQVAAELDRIEAERARLEAAGVPPAGTRMSGTRTRTASADAKAGLEAAGVPPAGTRMSGTRSRTRTADATVAPKPAKKPPPAPREPARHWVQLGHGGSATLGGVFDRLKDKAPKLLAGRDPWVALGSPNRLVVGPFASEQAAQNFADRLGKSDLTALAWTSETGQKVEKLSDQ
jgi:Flp pilus assembly protein TadD